MIEQLRKLSERLYQVCLYAYPSEHRKLYRLQMTQTFNDLCRATAKQETLMAFVDLWLRVLIDVASSASNEYIVEMRRKLQMSRTGIITLVLVIIFSILTGYINLNANEVQAPMACILLFSFLAGMFQPKAAWRWSVLIGLSIPLSYFIGFAVKYKVVDPPHYPITLIVLVIPALIATYIGVLAKRLISSVRIQAG